MSKIKDKTIAAANKIYRAIFRGAPNLYTTADVNRQLQLLTRRIDLLEKAAHGVISDMVWQVTGEGGQLMSIRYARIEAFGMTIYEGDAQSTYAEIIWDDGSSTRQSGGIYLVVDLTETTFNNDPTHEISGATFEGGEQSRPAADHLTCGGFRFISRNTSAYDAAVVAVNNGTALMTPILELRNGNWYSNCRKQVTNLGVDLKQEIASLDKPVYAFVRMRIDDNGTVSYGLSGRSKNFPATKVVKLPDEGYGIMGFQFMDVDTPVEKAYKIFPAPLSGGAVVSGTCNAVVSTSLYDGTTDIGTPNYVASSSKVEVEIKAIAPDKYISTGELALSKFRGRVFWFLVMV